MKRFVFIYLVVLVSIFHTTSVFASSVASYSSSNSAEFQSIYPSYDRLYHIQVGEPMKLTIFAYDDNGEFDVTPVVNSTILDSNIATVEKKGTETFIHGLKEGETIITAQFEGLTAHIPVTIFPAGTIDVHDVYRNHNMTNLTKERQSTLDFLNDLRASMGLEPLQFNEKLNKAAQAHSNYLAFNGYISGHFEDPNYPGFTGAYPNARTLFYGYENYAIGEVISWKGNGVHDAQELIDAPLHRVLLISPLAKDIGIGINNGKNTVMNTGDSEKNKNKIVQYPYHLQKNVPVSWYAAEAPNPMAPFGLEYTTVGYPISISSDEDIFYFKEGTITDSAGNTIDFYVLDHSVDRMASGNIFLIPKKPLNYGTRHEVNVTFEKEDAFTKERTKDALSWSFATEGYEDKVVSLYTEDDQLSASIGEPIKLGSFIAAYESGDEVDVTNAVEFIYDPEVMEVKDGYVTVKNATIGEYVFIQVKYEDVSEYVSIHVWEPVEKPELFLSVDPFDINSSKITGKSIPFAKVLVEYDGNTIDVIFADKNGEFSLLDGLFEHFLGENLIIQAEDDKGNRLSQEIKIPNDEHEQSPIPDKFSDVPSGHYAEDPIYYLVEQGALYGVGNSKFGFGQPLTRWQAVLLLNRINDVSLENRPDPGFIDVPKGYRYYDAIAAAVDEGLFLGTSPTTFEPDAQLTRSEMAVILQRIFKFPETKQPHPFTDVKNGVWYTDAINRLYASQIAAGVTKTTFGPNDIVTREQFAVFLARAMNENFRP